MTAQKSAKKVVLAYSGGLDTSIIIPWLKENYGCEVVAFAADVGQGQELTGLEDKAIKTGASKLYVKDLRHEFLTDYVFPMMQAGAIYEGKYLLGTSVARPIIAKHMMDIVAQEGADAVAHGCTGKGNDQVRFELTFKSCDPNVRIIAPWREWDIKSREDALDYAAARKIPVTSTKEKLYSHDRNLWHLSSEGGALEDPWNEPPQDLWQLTVDPLDAPTTPEYVEVTFEKGVPTAVNGKKLDPVALVETLNKIGNTHGIGRVDIVENRLVGMKSRGVYETPGGDILYKAHAELESIVLDRETAHYKQVIALKYADLVYNGQWFTPLRVALDGFVKETQKHVTGKVRVRLYKGSCVPVGRASKHSLYREDFATFGRDSVYNQKDAEGFINLFGLPVTVQALVDKKG